MYCVEVAVELERRPWSSAFEPHHNRRSCRVAAGRPLDAEPILFENLRQPVGDPFALPVGLSTAIRASAVSRDAAGRRAISRVRVLHDRRS